ncbi:hypothetical protein I4U23_016869 [Adineta vaga]|nr:hypothetical protein I4U23_016869 [Adineta vaga]
MGNLVVSVSGIVVDFSQSNINEDCGNGSTFITFDDLTAGTAVPNGYSNIDWNNAVVYNSFHAVNGYTTGTVSKNCTSMNSGGNPMTMTRTGSTLFTLHSAAIAAAWYDNLQLNVVGYRSNSTIANYTYTLQVFSVSNIKFIGYSNLDEVIFSTSNGTQNPSVSGIGTHYAMDNLCISVI